MTRGACLCGGEHQAAWCEIRDELLRFLGWRPHATLTDAEAAMARRLERAIVRSNLGVEARPSLYFSCER